MIEYRFQESVTTNIKHAKKFNLTYTRKPIFCSTIYRLKFFHSELTTTFRKSIIHLSKLDDYYYKTAA